MSGLNGLPADRVVEILSEMGHEGDYWDYKQEWHDNMPDLLKDIICFANTPHDENCYLLFGIDDNGQIIGMKKNRRKQADILEAMDNLWFIGDVKPEISVETVIINEIEVDVLTVYDTQKTPVYLKKNYGEMLAGCVYMRIGDKNTPNRGISTIDTVTSGHITVNNQDITKIKDKDFADFRRENLGFIFQDFNLLDTLTIGENISLSLVINKQNPTDIEKRVHAIADKLGIRDILSKFPYEVSGGQKQRCACARALINEPKLILADEPTGALDSKASRLLLETMSEINKKMQATILMVTHDPFSASFCERILFLKDGKIFNEIFRGEKSRKDFFNEILDILTLLGGEVGNVR